MLKWGNVGGWEMVVRVGWGLDIDEMGGEGGFGGWYGVVFFVGGVG